MIPLRLGEIYKRLSCGHNTFCGVRDSREVSSENAVVSFHMFRIGDRQCLSRSFDSLKEYLKEK